MITEDLVVTPEAVTDVAAAAHGELIGCAGGYGGLLQSSAAFVNVALTARATPAATNTMVAVALSRRIAFHPILSFPSPSRYSPLPTSTRKNASLRLLEGAQPPILPWLWSPSFVFLLPLVFHPIAS